MRKQWFGDKRDYAKWNLLFKEVEQDATLCYIAMARPDDLPDHIEPEVLAFFDKYKDLNNVSTLFPGRFVSLTRVYRDIEHLQYFDEAMRVIAEAKEKGPIVVFVDPDTGIEPAKKRRDEHVPYESLRRIADTLRHSDKLIIYQHAHRNSAWIDNCVARLQEQSWMRPFTVRSCHDRACASDVYFLVVQRDDEREGLESLWGAGDQHSGYDYKAMRRNRDFSA